MGFSGCTAAAMLTGSSTPINPHTACLRDRTFCPLRSPVFLQAGLTVDTAVCSRVLSIVASPASPDSTELCVRPVARAR
jgi:hypothetical protein